MENCVCNRVLVPGCAVLGWQVRQDHSTRVLQKRHHHHCNCEHASTHNPCSPGTVQSAVVSACALTVAAQWWCFLKNTCLTCCPHTVCPCLMHMAPIGDPAALLPVAEQQVACSPKRVHAADCDMQAVPAALYAIHWTRACMQHLLCFFLMPYITSMGNVINTIEYQYQKTILIFVFESKTDLCLLTWIAGIDVRAIVCEHSHSHHNPAYSEHK